MIKPIHKFNNGRGATLCHCCSKIINTGFTPALYCNEICDRKHNVKANWDAAEYNEQIKDNSLTKQTRITTDNININKQTTKNHGKN
jgi:hypothetical protein